MGFIAVPDRDSREYALFCRIVFGARSVACGFVLCLFTTFLAGVAIDFLSTAEKAPFLLVVSMGTAMCYFFFRAWEARRAILVLRPRSPW